jgi:phosphate/phosphite/phosphonate ABC transporter binding protein
MHTLLACILSFTALVAADPAIVIALKPDKNPDAMAAERADLGKALGASLGRPVQVIVPLSDAVIQEGLANGSVDLGFLASTDVAKMAAPRPAQVLLASVVQGRTTYDSVWVALATKPYAAITDLKGKPVAFAKKTSTSGGIVPIYDLFQQGLITKESGPTGFFGAGNCWYGSGYVTAIERVLDGSAEAAAVSDYVMLGDKHLTPAQKAQLKIIDTQGPVPTHVLAVRASIDANTRSALAKALVGLEPGLRDRVFGGPLAEVDEAAHLKPIADALAFVKDLTL